MEAVGFLFVDDASEARLKVAIQSMSELSLTLPSVQSEFPDQPEKMEPLAATALRAITVPLKYVSEQSALQLIPAGELVIVPRPDPIRLTASVKLTAAGIVTQFSLE